MDMNLLLAGPYGWLVALALAAFTLWQRSKQPVAPADPTKPDPAPSPAPAPVQPTPADPFAPLPGLPGHPLLNLLSGVLLRWLGVGEGPVRPFSAVPDVTPEQSLQEDVALVTIAAAVKANPARASQLIALLK